MSCKFQIFLLLYFRNRLVYRILNIGSGVEPVQSGIASAFGIYPVAQENIGQVVFRIHPHTGAGEAGVAEG